MKESWQAWSVSPDRTHHLANGNPAYPARFEDVLSFHPPGLAAVRDSSGAYHIDSFGRPVYNERHLRTFGFYDDRAAVFDATGWFHVLVDGHPLYSKRYSWCGNFQSARCTVRDWEDRYFYLDLQGNPSYEERYRYAGDYKDRIAAVQREDGTYTHIDLEGRQVHGKCFLDLDVFHKGYARARDENGWFHINVLGCAVYERRFAIIEPFYNGQARVEDLDGSLLIINEAGTTVTTLREPWPERVVDEHRRMP